MKTYNYLITDPYNRVALGDEAERYFSFEPEAGVDYCKACGEEEDLIEGYCPNCLWQLFQNHTEEITEWNARMCFYDPEYDLSVEGAKKACLEDDPEFFIHWVMEEHPMWLSEIEVI